MISWHRVGAGRFCTSPEEIAGARKLCEVWSLQAIHRTKKTSSMPSVFETAPATSAIPITFATKSTWQALSAELPAQARQFASANGFAGKPGACLTLPAADGQIAH